MNWAEPARYICRKTQTPPEVNGDPRGWDAEWSALFQDIEGPDHPVQPRFATRVKMLWDAEYLYIGAWLEEPDIWATLTERDSVIFRDNDFEVFIDPDDDNHQYLEIEINALNTVWDLLLPKPYRFQGSAVNEWDALGMKHAVHIEGQLNTPGSRGEGWGVTLAIPWTDMAWASNRACPPRVNDTWRINFSRVEWDIDENQQKIPDRPEHNWVWSPQWQINMHCPEFWGFLVFADEKSVAHPQPTYWPERCRLLAYLQAREKGLPAPAEGLKIIEGSGFWIAECVATGGVSLTIRNDGRFKVGYNEPVEFV